MPVKHYYIGVHIPTSTRWTGIMTDPRMVFLENLNRWNRNGNGAFVYWELSEYAYDRFQAEKKAEKTA